MIHDSFRAFQFMVEKQLKTIFNKTESNSNTQLFESSSATIPVFKLCLWL